MKNSSAHTFSLQFSSYILSSVQFIHSLFSSAHKFLSSVQLIHSLFSPAHTFSLQFSSYILSSVQFIHFSLHFSSYISLFSSAHTFSLQFNSYILSSSLSRMDSKGETTEISYPNIFFIFDNFEEVTSQKIILLRQLFLGLNRIVLCL